MASLLGEQSRFLLFFKSMPSGKCHFFYLYQEKQWQPSSDLAHKMWLFLLCSTLYFGKTSIFFLMLALHGGKNFCSLWQYLLWSFQVRDTKLERFLVGNRISKVNCWILWIGVVSITKFDFQSQFSMSKIIGAFLIFFLHWRIWI